MFCPNEQLYFNNLLLESGLTYYRSVNTFCKELYGRYAISKHFLPVV